MSNIVIATTALADAGTLTGGGTLAATLPVGNLQTMQPGQAARWTSLTGMYAVLDLGAAAAVNLVALLAHNGSSAATWHIRGASSEAGLTDSAGYDSGAISMWPSTGRPAGYDAERLHSIQFLAPAQSYRWWRVDLADSANADGYFEAGRLIVDAAWQPLRNLRFDWGMSWDDPSAPVLSALGHQWPGPESRTARVFDFAIRGLSASDVATGGYEIGRKRGRRKDVFVVRGPTLTAQLHRNMVYGLLSEAAAIRRIAHDWYEQSFKLREFPV
jgi:hypothetical protein